MNTNTVGALIVIVVVSPRSLFLEVIITGRVASLSGVSRTDKMTLGKALVDKLGMSFVDVDDLHPVSNVEKMMRGGSLTAEDR